MVCQTIWLVTHFVRSSRRHKKGYWESLYGGEAELMERPDGKAYYYVNSAALDLLKGTLKLNKACPVLH